MRKWLAVAVALLLITGAAAEEWDASPYEALPNREVFLDDDGVTTVIRPVDQPFYGTFDSGDATVCAFIDYVELEDRQVVAVRVTVSTESHETIGADEMTIEAGGKAYCFPVRSSPNEYDMVYQEDYTVCLSDESLPLLKAIAKGKKLAVPFSLKTGETVLTGMLQVPAEDAAELYGDYTALKGDRQDLTVLRELWPVRIEAR